MKIIEKILIKSNWILIPMYIGLIIANLFYSFKFITELYQLIINFYKIGESEIMLFVLSLVDITMVSNLIFFIVVGSYSIFIKKLENIPIVANINSNTLKVKIGTSLIGVASIHLLKLFLNAKNEDMHTLYMQGGIFLLFIISTIALTYVEKIKHDVQHDVQIH